MALASIFYNNKCNIKMWTNSEDEKDILLKNRKSDKINYNYLDSMSINDLKRISELKNKYCPKAILHSDGVQAFGKIKINVDKKSAGKIKDSYPVVYEKLMKLAEDINSKYDEMDMYEKIQENEQFYELYSKLEK